MLGEIIQFLLGNLLRYANRNFNSPHSLASDSAAIKGRVRKTVVSPSGDSALNLNDTCLVAVGPKSYF